MATAAGLPRKMRKCDGENSVNVPEFREKQVHHSESDGVVSKQDILKWIDSCQSEIDNLNERCSEEVLKIEQRYSLLKKPIFCKRNEFIEKIPNFWSTTFLNHPQISVIVDEDEEECIRCLKKVEVEDYDDLRSGYRIRLHFEENPFFENMTVCKEFASAHATYDPSSGIPEIRWKDGKSLAECQEEREGRKRDRRSRTFFMWLTSQSDAASDVLAEAIKDEIWPNPLQYFVVDDAEESEQNDATERLQETGGAAQEEDETEVCATDRDEELNAEVEEEGQIQETEDTGGGGEADERMDEEGREPLSPRDTDETKRRHSDGGRRRRRHKPPPWQRYVWQKTVERQHASFSRRRRRVEAAAPPGEASGNAAIVGMLRQLVSGQRTMQQQHAEAERDRADIVARLDHIYAVVARGNDNDRPRGAAAKRGEEAAEGNLEARESTMQIEDEGGEEEEEEEEKVDASSGDVKSEEEVTVHPIEVKVEGEDLTAAEVDEEEEVELLDLTCEGEEPEAGWRAGAAPMPPGFVSYMPAMAPPVVDGGYYGARASPNIQLVSAHSLAAPNPSLPPPPSLAPRWQVDAAAAAPYPNSRWPAAIEPSPAVLPSTSRRAAAGRVSVTLPVRARRRAAAAAQQQQQQVKVSIDSEVLLTQVRCIGRDVESPKHFVLKLIDLLFSKEELAGNNVKGGILSFKGQLIRRGQLDPQRMRLIDSFVEQRFPGFREQPGAVSDIHKAVNSKCRNATMVQKKREQLQEL